VRVALIATGAVVLTQTAGAVAAADPIVGAPLAPRPAGPITAVAGSYAVEDLRVADPAGGLPWSFATFIARPPSARGEVVCVEIGRVLEGQLGMIAVGDVFRPFVPGRAPTVQCGARMTGHGPRAFGFSNLTLPAQLEPCDPHAGTSSCGGEERTAIVGSFGEGIRGAWTRDRTYADRLAVSKSGTFLAVFAGRFTEAAMPTIVIHASVCGPEARTDLQAVWRGTRRGCLLTFDVPSEPRPGPESAASRRARKRAALDRPVRVLEDRRAAPSRRFRARITVPIIVRASAEGYAYRLTGPAGARCERRATIDSSRAYQTSPLMIEGKPLELPIAAPRRDRPWCRGTYRLTLLYVQVREVRRRLVFVARAVGNARVTVR